MLSAPLYPSSISINDLYQRGFDVFRLDPLTYQSLRRTLNNESWVPCDDIETFTGIPDWMSKEKRCAPPGYSDALSAMLNDPVLFSSLRPLYHISISDISVTNGCSDLPWHTDANSAPDLFMLLYFSDPNNDWTENEDGSLSLGIRDILSNNFLILGNDPVTTLATIPPKNRTVVLINNRDPRFLHCVRGLPKNTQMERILINVGLRLAHRKEVDFG